MKRDGKTYACNIHTEQIEMEKSVAKEPLSTPLNFGIKYNVEEVSIYLLMEFLNLLIF